MVTARSSTRLSRPASSLLAARTAPAPLRRWGGAASTAFGGVRTLTATSKLQVVSLHLYSLRCVKEGVRR